MKRLEFEYKGTNYVAFVRRQYDTNGFCKARLFLIRPHKKWYQFRLLYIDTVHFFLTDCNTKEDIIDKFCYKIQQEMDLWDRVDSAAQLWRSL